MAKELRQKNFYYKRADLVGGDGRTLAELLRDALSRKTHPAGRAERVGDSGKLVRILDRPRSVGKKMFCAPLIEFTEGAAQECVRIDPDQLELAIRHLEPAAQEQFVASTAYIGVQDHHLVLLQSTALRSREVETHLNWLLRDETRVMPDGATLSLRDEPSRDARRKLSHVKSLTLRAGVPVDILGGGAEDSPKLLSLMGSTAFEIFRAAGRQGFFLDELKAEHALALEDIEIVLQIKRKGRHRKNSSIIDDLAYALRNSDDDVFELQTRSGKVLKSGELKLAKAKSVAVLNERPILASVAEKMHECLAEWLNEREVSET